jgi:hypothetical protein
MRTQRDRRAVGVPVVSRAAAPDRSVPLQWPCGVEHV